ncbi:flagellar export chaperone FliS [Photobacterium aphoticum]|uniref:Flagellar secretion chaperone FliS n=1 Tax=Photobacterium aphoticum TaxID=754436 RepID=A0A090RIK1_9GAMM|nr:flagellar export chaperone FliS [Photobacterium aphoticum]KLV00618.1 flagellar biosynthesis protein FliS [Photobacterium aphoticum]PSU46319.1 flagellar export chaperone FliS [Photobacterium aphoticum]GAL07357.1 flagellar biosynthesis protein FliS [Photobacterium aphoticum]GHA59038.1 flagellar protein FliS [Photobacterium aphoticum]
MMNAEGLGAYQHAQNHAQAAAASPHRLIQMLLEGLLDNLNRAKGFMERGQIADKGLTISKCLDILNGLSSVLDEEKGGDVTQELFRLYDYCGRRLFEANCNNEVAGIDEVIRLITDILEGWVVLKPEKVQVGSEQ